MAVFKSCPPKLSFFHVSEAGSSPSCPDLDVGKVMSCSLAAGKGQTSPRYTFQLNTVINPHDSVFEQDSGQLQYHGLVKGSQELI